MSLSARGWIGFYNGRCLQDLIHRMEFMHAWNKQGLPKSIALPYIFFTQGFLTGTLQRHARKHVIPIDKLDFAFRVTGTALRSACSPSNV